MNLRRSSALLFAILTTFLSISPQSIAAPPEKHFDIRGWVLMDYNMPYLRQMIHRAAEEGINHVQLCHRIGMEISHFLRPKRNRDVRELIDLAHKRGIKAYVWTHELDQMPRQFLKGGKVAAKGDAFWAWVSSRYDSLFDALPGLDGVVVTLTETKIPIDDDNKVVSRLTPPERLAQLGQSIHRVTHARGKDLILRTFTWIQEDYDWMLEAFRHLPDDVIIMSKVNWGDWFQHYPPNPFIGKVAPHRQIVEFDLAGQYHGDTMVPWVCAGFLQQEMQRAMSKGAAGVVARTEWSGRVFGSANEFNAVAFDALARDPDLDLEALWNSWAETKYGPQAAPHIITALKRTNRIANLLFFTRSFKVIQNGGALIGLSHMDGTRVMHSAFCRDIQSRWKPELIPIADDLRNPTGETMRKTIEEKLEARALIDSCLTDLERARPHLTGRDHAYLSGLFRNARLIARSWRWINEAYFRYVLLRGGDESQRAPLSAALDSLLEMTEEVERRFGERIYLLSPERMRHFVGDIRTLTGPSVKWFGSTNLESGRAPLLFDLGGDGSREIIINSRGNRVHGFRTPGEEVWNHDTFGLRVWYPDISDPVRGDVDGDGRDEFMIGAADGGLYLFDARGDLKWKFMTGNAIVAAPAVLPAASGPMTICASLDGHLYGLNGKGELLWKRELEGIARANLVANSASVFVGTQEGQLVCLNAGGRTRWSHQLPDCLTGALALHEINGRKAISVGHGSELSLFDLDGNIMERQRLPQRHGQVSVAARFVKLRGVQMLLVGTDAGRLVGIEPGKGLKFVAVPGSRIRTPVVQAKVGGQRGLLVGVDNAVVALDTEGREIWRFTAAHDALIGSGLLVDEAARELIFTGMDRKLYVIDLPAVANN